MSNENTDAWKISKAKELQKRIGVLANRLVWVTQEAQKFGTKLERQGFGLGFKSRSGTLKHWHKMSLQSLKSLRKKISTLEAQLKGLSK